jgi:signal transduction histidine kinase
MIRASIAVIATIALIAIVAVGLNRDGDADKAHAMLIRAATAIKKDEPTALARFKKGTRGFKRGDIYVFCFNLGDGVLIAGQPQNLGKDVRSFVDSRGDGWGKRLFEAAKKPQRVISRIQYMAPRPGTDRTEVSKASFVTAVDAETACGVGYYPSSLNRARKKKAAALSARRFAAPGGIFMDFADG